MLSLKMPICIHIGINDMHSEDRHPGLIASRRLEAAPQPRSGLEGAKKRSPRLNTEIERRAVPP